MWYPEGFFQQPNNVKKLQTKRRRLVLAKATVPFLLAAILFCLFAWLIEVPIKAQGGFEISKTVSADPVKAGESLIYTITVTNTNGGILVSTITDTVPAGATVLDAGGASFSNGILRWTRTATVGVPVQVNFTVAVTQAGPVVNNDYRVSSGVPPTVLDGTGSPVAATIIPNDPTQVMVEAVPNSIEVNPLSTVVLTIAVADTYGNPVISDTEVALDFDLGSIDNMPPGTIVTGTTSGGVLVKTLNVLTVAGTAHITASAAGINSGVTEVTFTSGPPDSLSVSASPSSVSTVGGETSTITASVQDQYNNPVNGRPVTFTTSLGELNGSGTSGVATTSNGQATVTLAGTTAGTATITATVGELVSNDTTQVYLAPGQPTQISFDPPTDQIAIIANGTSTATLAVLILDENNNKVTVPTLVTVTTTLGTLNGVGNSYSEITADGNVQITITSITNTGIARLDAYAIRLSTDRVVNFIPGPPAVVDLDINPPSIVADGVSTTRLTATAYDAFDNIVSGVPVTITFNTRRGSWVEAPPPTVSTLIGYVERNLRSDTTVGTVPVTVTAEGLLTPTVSSVEFIVGPPDNVVITAATTSITVGNTVPLTFTLFDSVGHVIPNIPVTITGSIGSVSPSPAGDTDTNGQLTRNLYSTVAGNSDLGVDSYNGSVSVDGDTSITFRPGTPWGGAVTAQSASIIADGEDTTVITATITDFYANPVSGVTPNITTTAGRLLGTGATNAFGVTTRTLRSSVNIETATVSVNGLTSSTPTNVNFVVGPVYSATLSASPASAWVRGEGSPDEIVIDVFVTDKTNHNIVNQTVNLTSTFGLDMTIDCGTGINGRGTTDGTGTVSCTLQSTRSESPDIYINGILAVGNTVTFDPGLLAYVIVTPTRSLASPLTLRAGDVYTFTATAYDTYDNPIPSLTNFTWFASPAGSPGGDGTITGGGQSEGVFVGTGSGLVRIMAETGGAVGITYVQVTPGDPVQGVIVASPLSAGVVPPFGGHIDLSVTVQDAYENPVGAGFVPDVTSTIGTVSGVGPTDITGVSDGNLDSNVIGTAEISVTNLVTVTGNTQVNFTAGPPTRVRVTSSETTLHANGTDTANLTVEILDAYDNAVGAGYLINVSALPGTVNCPVPVQTNSSGLIFCTLTAPTQEGTADFANIQYNSSPLVLTNDSDSVTFFVGNIVHLLFDPTSPMTVTAGVPLTITVDGYDVAYALVPPSRLTYDWFLWSGGGQFLPLSLDERQEVFTGDAQGESLVQITVSDGTSTRLGNLRIQTVPAPPSTADIVVTPPAITANTVSTAALTFSYLEDAYGNTVSRGEIFTVTIATQTYTGTAGVGAQAQVVITSTQQVGTHAISATNVYRENIALSGSPVITFFAGPPAQAALVSALPPEVVADGSSTSEIVLRVRDEFGNFVESGQLLTVSSGLGVTISGNTLTDENGLITRTLRAGLQVGTAVLTVSDGITRFVSSGNVELVPGPPFSATVVAGSTTVTAGGSTIPFTFTVEDEWGHPVQGDIITPTITPARGEFSGSRVATNGQVIQLLTPFTSTGAAVVGSQGVTVTGDTALTFGPNVASLALVSANPVSLTVGNSSNLTINVTDAFGNIVPPTAIAVTSTIGGIFEGASSSIVKTTGNGTGQITTILNSTHAGNEPLALSGPAGPLNLASGSDIIQFYPDDMLSVTLDITGTVIQTAGKALTITASSRDFYGNIIDPWDPMLYSWEQTASVNGPGFGLLTGVDSNNRTAAFVPCKVGGNQLRAVNGTYESEPLTVTVTAAPPSQALVPSSPSSVEANTISTTTIILSNLTDFCDNNSNNGEVITVTVDSRRATGVISGGVVTVEMTATGHAGDHSIFAESAAGPMTLLGFSTVTYRPGPPARGEVDAFDTIIPVDTMTATLSITIYDNFNNVVAPGKVITVTVDKARVGGNQNPTVDGKITRSLEPLALGDGNVSATGPNGTLFLTGDTVLTFIPGEARYANVTVGQTTLVGDGSTTTSIDVSISDARHFGIQGAGAAVITVSRGTVVPTSTLAVDGDFSTTFTSDESTGMVDMFISYNGAPLTVEGDPLELIAAPAYSVSLSANPGEIQLDTSEESTLVFSLFDEWNNPVTGGTVVTVTADLGNLVLDTGVTVGNVVTMTLLPGVEAGPVNFTVEASTGNGPLLLSGDTVEILPGNLHHIDLFPAMPVWVTAGSSVSFSARGYDRYNNQTSTGPFNWRIVYGSGDGILNNGVFTGTVAGTLGVQAYTSTIYSPEKSVTILPGALYTTVVSASPLTVPVGGVPSHLIITARDFYGNLVANGTSASVTTDLGTLAGSSSSVNGVLTRTLYSSDFSGRAGIYVNGQKSTGDTVFFSPRAWVTAVPTTLVANGTNQAEIRVRILDNSGLPTGNIPATITTTLGTLNYDDCTIDADSLLCTLTASGEIGTAYIYADGFPAQGVVTFTAGTPSRAYITANPTTVSTFGQNSSALTIEVQDAYGHKISDYNSPLNVTTSLGLISGVEPTIGGVTHRVFTGGSTPGVANLSVAGLTVSGTSTIDILGVVANISASPDFLPADGKSQSRLTISLEDNNGQVLTGINTPITVTTSLGTISASQPTVNGVTQRTLTAAGSGGMADISVEGVAVAGDTRVQFVGTSLVDGNFKNGLDDWIVANSFDPVTATRVYTTVSLTSDYVTTIFVTPQSGTNMARLGATTNDNTSHAFSETRLKQSIYVTSTGVTQATFWYRLLSYDVSVGSPPELMEWDPFKVLLNDKLVYSDGFEWSYDWQTWYGEAVGGPSSPKDMGWKRGILDLTPYAGQIVTLEFRLPNGGDRPEDNTWIYIDDISIVHSGTAAWNKLFLPVILR